MGHRDITYRDPSLKKRLGLTRLSTSGSPCENEVEASVIIAAWAPKPCRDR